MRSQALEGQQSHHTSSESLALLPLANTFDAIADGIAVEQFEDEEETADAPNSEGNSKTIDLGDMNDDQLRDMQHNIRACNNNSNNTHNHNSNTTSQSAARYGTIAQPTKCMK